MVRRAAFDCIWKAGVAGRRELGSMTALADEAIDRAIAELVSAGAAELDSGGAVVATAGLSGRATARTRHSLSMSGRRFHTWCAIDAIGIPAGVHESATALTRCGACRTAIEVKLAMGKVVSPEGPTAWCPASVCDNTIEGFCPYANLFCSEEHLSTWWLDAGSPRGDALMLWEVAVLGKAIWGEMSAYVGPVPSRRLSEN